MSDDDEPSRTARNRDSAIRTARTHTSWRINTTGETGTYHLQNGTSGKLLANVQQVQHDDAYAYVSASGIPSYEIGPWGPNPNVYASIVRTHTFAARLTSRLQSPDAVVPQVREQLN